ncbi:MAG TPA: ester cyclase [Roseiflexaceae bacterium]|nr:ester cyclase [Roseiflexaceae bacterium]
MSTEANKALVRRWWEEMWNKGNMSILDEVVAVDYDGHPSPTEVDFGRGPEGQKKLVAFYRGAFPDTHMTIEHMVAEGDMVALRWRATGTHTGELMGIPPSGRRAEVTGTQIVRVADGKLAEGWGNFDALGMMIQIGAIPMPGQNFGEPPAAERERAM